MRYLNLKLGGMAFAFLVLVVLVAWLPQEKETSKDDFPVLKGPYLGQKPPGMTPEIFAPGIISTENHEFSCAFTPDGKEFFFTRRHPQLKRNTIMFSKYEKERWTEPDVLPFAGDHEGFEPGVSADGQKLFFISFKKMPGINPPNIWVMEKNQKGLWQEPKLFGPPLNPGKSMYISTTLDGTIYTTDISKGVGNEQIVRCRYDNGTYSDFELIPYPINIAKGDMYPFIAPDESYLIFNSSRNHGRNDKGLFVSYKKPDDTWTKPKLIKTGLPNSVMPIVSPDGKYLFFTFRTKETAGDIYWVDAKMIENLKPEELK